VHALGQVAQFDAATRIPVERLALAINSRLGPEVEILSADFADPGFEAIGGARSKQYRYRIFNAIRRPLHMRNYVYHCWWPLDIDRMNDAARRIVGTHDFQGLASAKHDRETTIRTVHECHVERQPTVFDDAQEIHIVIQGGGFLYNMVRIVAGTLIEVGRGAMDPGRLDEILSTADRRLAGPTLGPEGLWLEWIRYE
jgi:tRNA pseudouridine38-40 synthase